MNKKKLKPRDFSGFFLEIKMYLNLRCHETHIREFLVKETNILKRRKGRNSIFDRPTYKISVVSLINPNQKYDMPIG